MEKNINYWVFPGISEQSIRSADFKVMDRITKKVSDYFKVSIGDIRCDSRKEEAVQARHVAIYFITKMTKLYHKDVAEFFNRDRTTVINSRDKIDGYIKVNRTYREMVYDLELCLKAE